MKRPSSKTLLIVSIVLAIVVAIGGYFFYRNRNFVRAYIHPASNPWNAATLGDIPVPQGFQRVEAPARSFTAYLRSLPLRPKDTKVMLYTKGKANYQEMSIGVVDLKLLSNHEQCADVTMRLRAEHLWQTRQYDKIRFRAANGQLMTYDGGNNRKAFESYLRKVYNRCNTASLKNETKVRPFKDVRPGDVFNYPSREKGKLGHAILVADVAKNDKGEIAVLCVEGNTPARDIHVLRNLYAEKSAWHIFKENEVNFNINYFRYHTDELRHY